MTTDVVNEAVTRVRLNIIKFADSFSREAYIELRNSCEMMRYYLMQQDVAGFDDYVDRLLADKPDRAGYILEEVFEHLGIEDRQELSVLLAQP